MANMTIIERAEKLNLPFGQYVIVASGAMEAHGIRVANDIDIVITQNLFEQLLHSGWQWEETKWEDTGGATKLPRLVNNDHNAEAFSEYVWGDAYRAGPEELIPNAEVIDNIPFIPLEELLKWKKAAMREKDLQDIVLIEAYLENHANNND